MNLPPPQAKIEATRLEKHGHVRIDNYFWLNQRENPEVVRYLEAENAYTEAVMAHTSELQEKLFEEIKGRIKQDDSSVPYKKDGYYYYVRFEEGKEYPIYCRRKGSLEAPEEVMIDANILAEGHDFFSVGQQAVSSNGRILAYATDTVGRRIYTLFFKDLVSGELLEDVIPEVTGNVAWANDNLTAFYSKKDLETLRPFQVFRHVLGSDPSSDQLVYEEKDEAFGVYLGKSKSRQYITVVSIQTLSTEVQFLDADHPRSELRVFHPRERDLEYEVDHYQDKFYIRTNYGAKNFRLMQTPVGKTGKDHWKEVIAHRQDVLLEDFAIFKNHLVVEERRNGLIQLRIIPWGAEKEHYVDFGEPAYMAYLRDNHEFDTEILRYSYTSLTTPHSTFDYEMTDRRKTLMKEEEVLGGFDKDNYKTERLTATAKDGSRVPISLVFRKSMAPDGDNPLLLLGYGAYGYSLDASFRSSLVSLLDRGFAFAMAHIRGGEELGRSWYEDGRLLKKKNTFTDFIDCAEHLIQEGFGDSQKLFAVGGSAGGLLMGAVINARPDLFRGVVAHVPFVDVVTTMLDTSIPLTTGEYDEWGDPNQKEYYEYMLSYSPYDNLAAQEYPHLLVTTGLHDSQVQYWEPAKWVAKLRTLKTDSNRLLLKTKMEAGHGGVSGRYRRYRETAFEYAFLLDILDQ